MTARLRALDKELFIIIQYAIDTADPSSVQDACHI